MSFKVEYAAVENASDSDGWAGNGQRFATQREAEASGIELRARVPFFKSHRVTEVDDPTNYVFDFVSNLPISLPEPIWVPGAPVEDTPPEPAPEPGTAITDVPPPVANVVPPTTAFDAVHAEPEATVVVEAPVQVEAPAEPEAPVDVPAPEPVVPADTDTAAS